MIAEIFSIFSNANAGSFASVQTLTNVNIPQKWGFDKGAVTKYTNKVVQIGANYESAVNRHRDAEGKATDFKAESLPWGEWLVTNRVITHKGKTYYRVYDIANGVHEVVYFVNGVKATEEQMSVIKAWLDSKAHTSRQGVDNEVKPTNIEESNIISVKCGSKFYKAVDSDKVALAYSK